MLTALLVLLYAQPVARIQQLTVGNDITTDDGQLLIRLGNPATPTSRPPFDDVIRQHLAARRNQMTAANTTSRWLFPGRASRTADAHHLAAVPRLHNLDIPNLTNRSRAIREMLRQAPPIIVAAHARPTAPPEPSTSATE